MLTRAKYFSFISILFCLTLSCADLIYDIQSYNKSNSISLTDTVFHFEHSNSNHLSDKEMIDSNFYNKNIPLNSLVYNLFAVFGKTNIFICNIWQPPKLS